MGNWTGMGNGNENLGKSSTGRDETTARRDFGTGACSNLVHVQRSTAMDFEFHLSFGPAVNTLGSVMEMDTPAHFDRAFML